MDKRNRMAIAFALGSLLLILGIYATQTNLIEWRTPFRGYNPNTRIIALGIGALLAVVSLIVFPDKVRKFIRHF